jgi:lipopolysaccharide transport system permease protein
MKLQPGDHAKTSFSPTSAHIASTDQVVGRQWDSSEPDKPYAIIKSESYGVELNLGELWAYRELLYFLILRDLKVRYKQTLMGVLWVLLQPLAMMLIFTVIFNRFVQVDGGSFPYPLFAFSGLVLWLFFANAILNSTTSLISNTNLLTKVYFPRLFIPTASVGAGLVDLLIAFTLVIALFVYYRVTPTWNLLLLPLFLMLIALLALGMGLLFSALTVKYRDLRHALPFLTQIWMFASPVIYPTTIVPVRWHWLLIANPVTGIIEGFRASLFGRGFNWGSIAVSVAITVGLLALAVYVFRRTEYNFADVI